MRKSINERQAKEKNRSAMIEKIPRFKNIEHKICYNVYDNNGGGNEEITFKQILYLLFTCSQKCMSTQANIHNKTK